MGPIFIGGPARSGKTLLRWILSSHPDVFVSRRTEMWPRFLGRFGDLARADNLDRCLRAMFERPQIAALEPDEAAIRRDLSRAEPTYARLFALIHEHHARRLGKARWGDQSPGNELLAGEMLSSYEGARFLHVIRDPRDCHAAELDRRGRAPGAVGPAAAAWVSSASLAARNAERFPDAYTVVRYESLVTEPEATVRALCERLDLAFVPSMLRLEGAERYRGEREASADGSPITTRYVGAYRRALIRCDVAYVQAVAGRAMERFGYEPDPIRLTAGERIYCAASWPVSMTRAGVRRAVDALHRRPAGMARSGAAR